MKFFALVLMNLTLSMAQASRCTEMIRDLQHNQSSFRAQHYKARFLQKTQDLIAALEESEPGSKKAQILGYSYLIAGRDLFWVRESLKPQLELWRMVFESREKKGTDPMALQKIKLVNELLRLVDESPHYSLFDFIKDWSTVDGLHDVRVAVDLLFLNGGTGLRDFEQQNLFAQIDDFLSGSTTADQVRALEETVFLLKLNR